jgi:hypothetical protein
MQPAHRTTALQLLVLFLAPLLTFLTALHHPFIDLDDDLYVSLNPNVLHGVSQEDTAWAFTTTRGGYYIPLTWLSLQLDASLSGDTPEQIEQRLRIGGEGPLPSATVYHLDNAIQHALATCLLFLFLRKATGRRWPAFLVALLWSLHPLRVESVAWITERKDTLAALFGFLACFLYVHPFGRRRIMQMTAVAAAFTASLLAKPLFVSLPLLLLLLDVWPLKGTRSVESLPFALLTKLHLFFLAAGASVVTIFAQHSIGALDLVPVSLSTRLAHAAIAPMRYLYLQFLPVGLSVRYPYDLHPAPGAVALSLLLLAAITAACIALRRSRPHLLVGWLWFLVSLLPMAGILQAGEQAYADRFTLFPSVGLLMMLVYSLPPAAFAAARLGTTLSAAAALAGLLLLLTLQRLTVWRSSVALLEDALRTAPNAYDLHYNVALAESRERNFPAAARHYQRSMELKPDFAPAFENAVRTFTAARDAAGLLALLQEAVAMDPNNAGKHDLLGRMLASTGHLPDALPHFEAAVRLDPAYPPYRNHLDQARAALGPASVPATVPASGPP